MAQTFAYRIRNSEDRLVRGMLTASSQSEAMTKTRALGGIVLELRLVDTTPKKKFGLPQRLGLKDKIVLTEQLAVMLKAGITLVQALKGLQEETVNKRLARILEAIIVDVEGGLNFSDALEKFPKVFSNIYCQMIKSAEKTGNLAEVLNKLTVQQQKEFELSGKVKGALIYPAIISVLLVAVIIIVVTFILPKLTGIFTQSGVKLPWTTQILMGLSDFMVTKWYLLILGLIALAVGLRLMMNNPKGLYIFDSFKIRIPVLGTFLKKSYMARFAQSFASLAQAGVPVLEVFKTLKGVIGNSVYEKEIEHISSDVENGIKVSVAIRKSKYFPPMIGQLVSVGEQSGDLAGIFTVLGDFFEKEVDTMAKNLSTILEPIIMIFMGVGVAFVVISVLQPILNLTSSI